MGAVYLQSYAARYGAEQDFSETRFYKYVAPLGLDLPQHNTPPCENADFW